MHRVLIYIYIQKITRDINLHAVYFNRFYRLLGFCIFLLMRSIFMLPISIHSYKHSHIYTLYYII